MSLELEVATYNRLLPTLMNDLGKFVLIKDGQLIDKYDTYQDALQAGYLKYGLERFLVKQVAPAGQVAFFTRAFTPCHP